MEFKHIPILLEECLNGLNIKANGVYLDGTLGGAGHGYEIASRLSENGIFIGLDQDEEALDAAEKKLSGLENRDIRLMHSNFADFENALFLCGIQALDGVLLDLGISSYQIDNPERGFTYMKDAPLDMRMDKNREKTAEHIVNTYSQAELTRIFKQYGEEEFAGEIARKIVGAREKKAIKTSYQLNEIIDMAIPKKIRVKRKGHPAKQVYQALRIESNDELKVVEDTLPQMVNYLNPGGRLCVITFHSLEDRIVKNIFRNLENPCTCPRDFPICACGKKPLGKVITRKPIVPSEKEWQENERSHSAKLRIFERI